VEPASGPFYGFNRPGAKISEGLIYNWWRQGMMGSVKAHYECIKAFSETDFTQDLRSIDVPVLVIHSEDDQIVPYADSAPLTIKLLQKGRLITYKDLPHGCCQTHPDIVNADVLAFIREEAPPQDEKIVVRIVDAPLTA
jgi:non-heme chloroperoxidase